MNAKLPILAVVLSLSQHLCADHDYHIPETSKFLSKLLGSDWKVSGSDNTITIESSFDVWLVPMMQRGSRPPEFSDATGEESLTKEAMRQHYLIKLEYSDFVDRKEFEKRIAERKRYSDILRFGASGKEFGQNEWSIAYFGFLEIRIPRFTGFNYSIYRITPDVPGKQVYPVSAVAKIGAAKELIDAVMGHCESPYD